MTASTVRLVALPEPEIEEYPGANIMAASLRIRERARGGRFLSPPC